MRGFWTPRRRNGSDDARLLAAERVHALRQVLVQVHRPGRFNRLNPLAEELVVATPDGEMTGEYTLASEGNDPRRYRFV